MIKMAGRDNIVVARDSRAYQDGDGWHEGIIMDREDKRIVLIDVPVCKYILSGEAWGMRPASRQVLFAYVRHEGRRKVIKLLFQNGTVKQMLEIINTFNRKWLPRYIIKDLDVWDTKGVNYYQLNKERMKATGAALYKKKAEAKKIRDKALQAIWRENNAKGIKERNNAYRQRKKEEKLNSPDGHK